MHVSVDDANEWNIASEVPGEIVDSSELCLCVVCGHGLYQMWAWLNKPSHSCLHTRTWQRNTHTVSFIEWTLIIWGQAGYDSMRKMTDWGEMILMENMGTHQQPPENLVKIPLEEMESFYRFIVSSNGLICKLIVCHVLRRWDDVFVVHCWVLCRGGGVGSDDYGMFSGWW